MFFPVCLDTGAESVSAQDRLAREWRYKTTLFLREFAGSAFAATTIAPEPAFNQWAIQLRNAFAASCASLVLFALSRRRSRRIVRWLSAYFLVPSSRSRHQSSIKPPSCFVP